MKRFFYFFGVFLLFFGLMGLSLPEIFHHSEDKLLFLISLLCTIPTIFGIILIEKSNLMGN